MMVLVLVAALLAADPPARHQEMRGVMGTVATIEATAPSAARAVAAVEAGFRALARTDSLMSTWGRDSDVLRVNAAAGGPPVPVDAEVASVVTAALAVATASGGAYDPTVLPLLRVWGLRGQRVGTPSGPEVAAASRFVDWRRVTVTPDGRVGLQQPGMELDLGGIAKGWAQDRAASAMRSAGALGGTIDVGGALLVFGPDAAAASVALADPGDRSRTVAEVPLGGGAAATSGQSERRIAHGDSVYGHIIDPRNGRPVARRGSVTVTASTAVLADALATAAFVLGPDEGAALVARHQGARCWFLVEDGSGAWRPVPPLSAAPARNR